jgi:putative hydrolase of the HAD superfamily
MIKAIVFDGGGVLFSNSWFDPVFDKIPELLDLDKNKADEIFYKHWPEIKTGKKNEDDLWSDFVKNANKKISQVELKNFYYNLIKINPIAFELVKRLSGKYSLYILNNDGKGWMDFKIREFGLKKYFKDFICSSYVGVAKPDEKIFRIFLKKTGLRPEECLFIDDKEVNIKQAKSMGFNTILFKSVGQLKNDLESLGVKIL